MQPRMNFPTRSCVETNRQRRERLALSRRAAATPAPAKPAKIEAFVRVKGDGELVARFADFKAMDYGQLCQFLKLRPSKPHAPAAA